MPLWELASNENLVKIEVSRVRLPPSLCQGCSEFRILTDLNPFSSLTLLCYLPVTSPNDISLTPFFREEHFSLACHSIHPPRHLLLNQPGKKREREKKSWNLFKFEKMLPAFFSVCDLWNVTSLSSILIKKPQASGEAGHQ